jgi:hypothetical protein
MRRVDIIETCSCGATLRLIGEYAGDVSIMAERWRREHRHELPPTATLEHLEQTFELEDEIERHNSEPTIAHGLDSET